MKQYNIFGGIDQLTNEGEVMTAKEKYEKETGDIEPNNQIAHYEWHQRFVAWMEDQLNK